jgi:hypothetical protein
MKGPRLLCVALLIGPAKVSAQEAVDYLRDVKPLLKQRCVSCHGALKQKAKLRLDAGALIRKGGRNGPAVQPGQPGASLLIERVSATQPGERMPPEGKPLTLEQIGLLTQWIKQGASSPAGEKPEADPRAHWAFQKPVRPKLPAVADATGAKNPVDAFLAAEWARHGLTPRPPASKEVLLRRVYLDLTGLPPTRQELHAFLADPAPDAYEQVVDRLLASPRYGERWARHWMDVWRYSDWYGRRSVPDVLNSYGMIWRWRDWIVRAVNEDRGYDRMILDMLAADELTPADDSNVVATGFIVRNFFRWNYNYWKKDLVEHTGKAFLGLTLNCCHCHDHKYDPVTQEEYFKFRAFFEPIEIRHDRVPGEPDPGPYPKYNYGSAYGPIKSGMVRIFDEKLDAQTFMYSGGDHRNKIDGKPPVPPGVPAALGGIPIRIQPVALPAPAFNPSLKDFVQAEELAKRRQAVTTAEAELAAARARLSSAAAQPATPEDARFVVDLAAARCERERADLASFQARLTAERGKYLDRVAAERQKELNRAACQAERNYQVQIARFEQTKLRQALTAARRKPMADAKAQAAIKQLEKQRAAAEKTLADKRKLLAAGGETYTPVGPLFPDHSSGRRTALARWIGSTENPLTARVAVNHLWAWHFGRPLVETTNDFGRNGKPPSHPEVLDWLAVEFMNNGWQMKPLHRLIVTSYAYRMASDLGVTTNPNRTRDQDNRYLWHFSAARMEAEEVRDSVLYLAGQLDETVGGPDIPHEQGLTSRRRSLYFTHHGESKMQFLELFDGANACECYKRTTSVMPQQALALGNSDLTVRQARRLTQRLAQQLARPAEEEFITSAFEQVLGRSPSAAERQASASFLARQRKLFEGAGLKAGQGGPVPTGDGPATELARRAWENLVHALMNHNDFVTIR